MFSILFILFDTVQYPSNILFKNKFKFFFHSLIAGLQCKEDIKKYVKICIIGFSFYSNMHKSCETFIFAYFNIFKLFFVTGLIQHLDSIHQPQICLVNFIFGPNSVIKWFSDIFNLLFFFHSLITITSKINLRKSYINYHVHFKSDNSLQVFQFINI